MHPRLQQELDQQRRWVPRSPGPAVSLGEELAANEFLPPGEQRLADRRRLREMVRHADATVPHWREVFGHLRLRPSDLDDPSDLRKLPVMAKTEVTRTGDALRSEAFAFKDLVIIRTSGHSAPPAVYWRGPENRLLQAMLVQRQMRWFGYDPGGRMAWISTPEDLPRDGASRLAPGETRQRDHWPGPGRFFHTGDFRGLSCHTAPEEKVRWLEERDPTYLRATSSELEELAFLFQGRDLPPGLRGLRAIAEPLSPGMRRRIEETFGVRVDLGYGSDELGWLAAYCPEGDRYHVQTENAWVEIVDAAGDACAPGEWGRVVVTTVGNPAMPLFRLDTGDVACRVDEPCPCGRTLPSLGPRVDRAGVVKAIPPSVSRLVTALRERVEALRGSLSLSLRKYQVARTAEDRFELRLVPRGGGGLPPALVAHLEREWEAAAPPASVRFRVVEVGDLPRSRNGKFHHFVDEVPPAG